MRELAWQHVKAATKAHRSGVCSTICRSSSRKPSQSLSTSASQTAAMSSAAIFFDAVPAGADGYLLKHVLHHWEDDKCVKLLRNIHAAATPGAQLFILESVVPSGNTPHMSKHLDLMMLVLTRGGRERTRAEWEALLTAGDFGSPRFTDLAGGPLSVIEAQRA